MLCNFVVLLIICKLFMLFFLFCMIYFDMFLYKCLVLIDFKMDFVEFILKY